MHDCSGYRNSSDYYREEYVRCFKQMVYTFEVAKSANKIEIAKACEELFKVEVAKVNTVSVRGKFRRQGRNNGGYSKSWKKAIITLKENSKPIEFFEGMM